MYNITKIAGYLLSLSLSLFLSSQLMAQSSLFTANEVLPLNDSILPDHVQSAQSVTINSSALNDQSLSIELFGKTLIATRDRTNVSSNGRKVWIGHLQGNMADHVIITSNNGAYSGIVQHGNKMYRIGYSESGKNRLLKLDLSKLPVDDVGGFLPQGGGSFLPGQYDHLELGDNIVQDLLVVYTQRACNSAGNCPQLEADIVTAVTEINTAYMDSGINVTMNLVGTLLVNYNESNASTALNQLASNGDGYMDIVHTYRNNLGADIVALIYDGEGCGIGYLNSNANTAFSVTQEICLVGNRTLAHEIGHNQGAHHDRQTVGGGLLGAYNYGYRRCNDGSVDDFNAPYFRTIMSYYCADAIRAGRFSNPQINYLGVPTGVDPNINQAKGAWTARTINESAAYVASFRASVDHPPIAPNGLNVLTNSTDMVRVRWVDNSYNEDRFVVQSSTDSSIWSTIATVAEDTTIYDDTGLTPNTTYYYRVRAENSAGSSAYSNIAFTTTRPFINTVVDVAKKDIYRRGSVQNTFRHTQHFGSSQIITEEPQFANNPNQRYRHIWKFIVSGGDYGVDFLINAWVSGSEGAKFSYKTVGGDWTPMLTVDNNSPTGRQQFSMPNDISGVVKVRVDDADRTRGEEIDSITISYIRFLSYDN